MQSTIIHIILSIFLFLGGYQPYFWCQRHTKKHSVSINYFIIDDHIPFWPNWVWFYTLFYYPVIVLVVSLAENQNYAPICFSYFFALTGMCCCYLLLPTATPNHWRDQILGNSVSERVLKFVRSVDDSNNCFPSGHAAITVITAYHMSKLTSPLFALFWAISIHISCLVCKQHYVVDLIAGACLGLLTIFCYNHFLINL